MWYRNSGPRNGRRLARRAAAAETPALSDAAHNSDVWEQRKPARSDQRTGGSDKGIPSARSAAPSYKSPSQPLTVAWSTLQRVQCRPSSRRSVHLCEQSVCARLCGCFAVRASSVQSALVSSHCFAWLISKRFIASLFQSQRSLCPSSSTRTTLLFALSHGSVSRGLDQDDCPFPPRDLKRKQIGFGSMHRSLPLPQQKKKSRDKPR